MVWHPYYTFTNDGSAPAPAATRPSGGVWNPLIDFEEDKRTILEAARLVEEEADTKRERAKARKLERDVQRARTSADIKALAARAAWAIELANELRREEDDEEDAIVLLALLH